VGPSGWPLWLNRSRSSLRILAKSKFRIARLDRGELDKLIERSTVVTESRGRDPHDYRDEPRARDYRYDEDYHHPKKRHRGFLGELFDFDLEAVEVRRSRNSFRWFAVHSVLGCALLRRLPAEHAQHHEEAYDIGECDAPRTCSNVGDNIAIGSLSMLRCGWPASRRPRARQTSGRDRRAGCTLKAPQGARPYQRNSNLGAFAGRTQQVNLPPIRLALSLIPMSPNPSY
jgi:Zn-finger nucleic acid-binding protein